MKLAENFYYYHYYYDVELTLESHAVPLRIFPALAHSFAGIAYEIHIVPPTIVLCVGARSFGRKFVLKHLQEDPIPKIKNFGVYAFNVRTV